MVIIFKYSIRRIKKPFLLDAIRKSIQFKKTEKGTRKCNKVQYRMMMKY